MVEQDDSNLPPVVLIDDPGPGVNAMLCSQARPWRYPAVRARGGLDCQASLHDALPSSRDHTVLSAVGRRGQMFRFRLSSITIA